MDLSDQDSFRSQSAVSETPVVSILNSSKPPAMKAVFTWSLLVGKLVSSICPGAK